MTMVAATWILILVYGTSAGTTMTSIPGYKTKQTCTQSGQQFAAAADGAQLHKFICIVGAR
jgi:hypothetical protein